MTSESLSNMASRQLPHQKRGRPPINQQQSNSVPSTPVQHARDFKWNRSRSPSPSKTQGANSPLSIASEAVSAHPPPKRQPDICRFETGAEMRKRRIIYTDGGNDPLPPPPEEPKKVLEPHEDAKLTGDMRALYDRLLPTEESEERRVKLVAKLERIFHQAWPGKEIKVNVFGSSGNLLSSTDSDVDVCITTTEKELDNMHELAKLLHANGMDKVICRASAKVPIVKIWDPELQLACDLNVNNPLALENTRMIKTYVQMDDRIRPLAKIIKYWTKQRILNDAAFGGTISSYTWICMIINFLQTRDPPILPSLQKIPDKRSTAANGDTSAFADDLDNLRGCGRDNKESLGQLLFHFFRHYGYVVDYGQVVISVREGRLMTRKEKGWHAENYQEKEARSRLCVEEPFNIVRNLGNSADDYAFTGIHKEIRRAFDLIKEGQDLDKCCEQYVFPPEEKPIFHRPPPKPAPVLRRSASQSGPGPGPRNQSQGQGRGAQNSSQRNGRNQSNQRNNNRRASSGASYANQRMPYIMSPPIGGGINPADYFSSPGTRMSTDQLHDQLYKQYQFLQAQQEALRNQLMQQQQQTQMHAQVRGVDIASSPRQRTYANTSNMSGQPQSPRLADSASSLNAAATAPLLPGYLYHYPASTRYPPPSPLSQSRHVGETMTNPSSPSLTNTTPSSRRTVQRSSVTETPTGTTRSQSQPGRSFPNPLTLQGLVHPGYDVSGALPSPYVTQRQVHNIYPQLQASDNSRQGSLDPPIPKEYIGYYVGQSPQLVPQYQTTVLSHLTQARDAPSRGTRRLTPPELQPLQSNGFRHQSRSPSPPGHARSNSTSDPTRAAVVGQMPYVLPPPAQQPQPMEERGPIIVNGSNTASMAPRQYTVDPTLPTNQAAHGFGLGLTNDVIPTEQIQAMSLDVPYAYANGLSQHAAQGAAVRGNTSDVSHSQSMDQAPVISSSAGSAWPNNLDMHANDYHHVQPEVNGRNLGQLKLSQLNGNSVHSTTSGNLEPPRPASPLAADAPVILSPVEELRTPSPTKSMGAPRYPLHPGPHHKLAHVVNGVSTHEDDPGTKEEQLPTRVADAANLSMGNSGFGPTKSQYQQALQQPFGSAQTQSHQWQQATNRKGHKKSKSNVAVQPRKGGEPLPLREEDRKGG